MELCAYIEFDHIAQREALQFERELLKRFARRRHVRVRAAFAVLELLRHAREQEQIRERFDRSLLQAASCRELSAQYTRQVTHLYTRAVLLADRYR